MHKKLISAGAVLAAMSALAIGWGAGAAAQSSPSAQHDEGQARRTEVIQLNHAEAPAIVQEFVRLWSEDGSTRPESSRGKSPLSDMAQDAVLMADPVRNQLKVSVSPRNYDSLKRWIAERDAPRRTVRIEVLTCEVGLAEDEEAAGVFKFGPGCSELGWGAFAFPSASRECSNLVSKLQKQLRLRAISMPALTTSENCSARILVGLATEATASTGPITPGCGIFMEESSFLGTNVHVTPKINADGSVTMRLGPYWCVPGQATFSEQTIEENLTIKPGETGVIAGPIIVREEKTERAIPLLGELPWLGPAFRYRVSHQQKYQLLMFFAPQVELSESPSPAASLLPPAK